MWENLSMKEKSAYMKVALKNDIKDLNNIRDSYNKFEEGGEIFNTLTPEQKDRLVFSEYSDYPEEYNKSVPYRNVKLDKKSAKFVDENISKPNGGYALYAGELPNVDVVPNEQLYTTLVTHYPFISDYTYTGHSELKSPSGSYTITAGGKDKNYNLFNNNCSNATRRGIEELFGTKIDCNLFTTPGDVRDFANEKLNGKTYKVKRGVYETKIPITGKQASRFKDIRKNIYIDLNK